MKPLDKGDDDRRRWRILEVGRAGDPTYVPQLIARLNSDESLENKRHIVRALGTIGGREAETRLLSMLDGERGMILGEVAQALGRLEVRALEGHPIEWVRLNACFAIRSLTGRPKRRRR